MRTDGDLSDGQACRQMLSTVIITVERWRSMELDLSRGLILFLLCSLLAMATASKASVMTPEQRREEVSIVTKQYVDAGPEFDAAKRESAHRLLGRIAADASRLTDQQYLLRLANVAAQAANGHDTVNFGRSPLYPELRIPVRLTWIGSRLFVARAERRYERLAGAEVLRIGRWTPEQLARALAHYQGGTEAYQRWSTGWLFHDPAMLHAMGATESADVVPLRARRTDGQIEIERLPVVSSVRMPAITFPAGLLSPLLSQDEVKQRWVAAGSAANAPLYLQQPGRFFRLAELADLHALYVQFRSNFDMGDQKIAPFVASVRQRLETDAPENLILDLRFDTGGDNTQTRELMRQIALKVRNRIFILAGPYTFSAGIASEAALIHDGGAKVTVMGDEPGDQTHWWSEHHPVCLPYSKICMDRQMGRWDVISGCAGDKHCFGDRFDIRVRTLEPTVRHELSPAEWLEGRDLLMEDIGRLIREGPARSKQSWRASEETTADNSS